MKLTIGDSECIYDDNFKLEINTVKISITPDLVATIIFPLLHVPVQTIYEATFESLILIFVIYPCYI